MVLQMPGLPSVLRNRGIHGVRMGSSGFRHLETKQRDLIHPIWRKPLLPIRTPCIPRFLRTEGSPGIIRPSHRPQQLSIVSSFLRSAGRGLVAGDFNPVLAPRDQATRPYPSDLAETAASHPHPMYTPVPQDGYTWGADGKQRFPPNRMDKVALLGLEARGIRILEPKRANQTMMITPEHRLSMEIGYSRITWSILLSVGGLDGQQDTPSDAAIPYFHTQPMLWSDHHGLICSFGPYPSDLAETAASHPHPMYTPVPQDGG
jgi:hypothetical protein